MATISEITNMKPSWEKAKKIYVSEEGIEIRLLKEDKRVFALTYIEENAPKKEFNRIFGLCLEETLKYFNFFFDESFAENWDYSKDKRIICEARTLELLKFKTKIVEKITEAKFPKGYALIRSIKERDYDNKVNDYIKFTHKMIASHKLQYLTLEKDTIEAILFEELAGVLPSREVGHILWDAHDAEYITELAKNLQFLPREVKNSAYDLVRKRLSRSKKNPKVLPKFIGIENPGENDSNDYIPELSEPSHIEETCLHAKIKDSLHELSPEQFEVINLVDCQGLTESEAARQLKKSRQTVNKIRKAAITKLKRYLENRQI